MGSCATPPRGSCAGSGRGVLDQRRWADVHLRPPPGRPLPQRRTVSRARTCRRLGALAGSGVHALSTLGWQKVASVDLPDGDTLVVTTTEPYAPFLSTVATTYLCPRAALAEGIDSFREVFSRAPIGTGPFRVTGWEPGGGVTLGRWDDYWGEAARFWRESSIASLRTPTRCWPRWRAGEIDVAGGGSGAIPPDRASTRRTLFRTCPSSSMAR